MRVQKQKLPGVTMRLTTFGFAILVLVMLAILARFTGNHAGRTMAQSPQASQAATHP